MKVVIRYLCRILPHLGIALIALAMTLGYFYNWRGKAALLKTDKTNVFITKNKEIKVMPFALTLTQFNATLYETGKPKHFEAIISVFDERDMIQHLRFKDLRYLIQNFRFKVQDSIRLVVNHPYKMGFGQDLYLISYDRTNPENPEWCTVELVYDPFQGVFLAGIIFLIVGLCLLGLKFIIIG